MRYLIKTICLITLLAIIACAQGVPVAQKKTPQSDAAPRTAQPEQKLPPDQNKFAVVITGISGEESYTKKFAEWTTKLREALTGKLGFADEKVIVLTEKPEGEERRATAEGVRQLFVELKNSLKPDNQLFVFFIGHGSFVDKVAKFNLVGPDLSVNEYSAMLNALPAKTMVIANMASASGEFVKPLTGEGRIIITATRSGMEQNATRFPEYFIGALGNTEADADKNGRVSVFEAFEYASKMTEASFKQKGVLVTEHSLLEDNGDGKGFEKTAEKPESGDGSLAKLVYFDSLPQQQAGGDPALAKLYSERLRLEGEIGRLKSRKTQMSEDDFDNELEKLLVELATLNQTIKASKK
ncbi:MAG: hypothetical protein SF097_16310 [Acidobacteriota bacterium]|nr:hypothetical protein [Acidobacteriota bacterium]